MKHVHFSTKWLVVSLCFSAIPAMAYIDPGLGGFIWQGFVAVSVGVIFHILRFLRVMKKDKNETTVTPTTQEENLIHECDPPTEEKRAA